MKFKVGDLVRPTRETIIDYIENGEFENLEYYNEFQIIKIDGIKVFYGNKDGEYYTEKELEFVPEEPEFEQGEEIEVSRDGKKWEKRIYLTTINLYKKFYICVSVLSVERYNSGLSYSICECPYARRRKPQLTRKEIAEKFGVAEDFRLLD